MKKDLKVDRSAFDRIISSGGFVSVNTGRAPDATAIPVTHQTAEEAFDSLLVSDVEPVLPLVKWKCSFIYLLCKNHSHGTLLPQGKEERSKESAGYGGSNGYGIIRHCSNTEACEVECPQGISVLNIARMNFEYNRALFFRKKN